MWFSRKSFSPPNGTIPFRIGQETTYLTEPLCRDGESIDYVLAVEQCFAPSGSPEENGYRDLLLGLGQAAFDSSSVNPVQWEYCCSKLDLDPGLQPALRYEPLSDDLLDKPRSGPWTGAEFPQVEQWFIENEPLYRLFETAIAKPTFYTLYRKSETSMAVLLPEIMFIREIARCFVLRSNYRLGTGEAEAAWRDVLAIFQLARHQQNHPLIISQLIGFAIEGTANAQAQQVLKYARFDVPRLRQCLGNLASLPESMSYDNILLSERLYCLGTLYHLSRFGYGPVGHDTILPPEFFEEDRAVEKLIRKVAFDWNIILKRCNELFDEIERERSMASTEVDPFAVPEAELRLTVRDYRKLEIGRRSELFARRLVDRCGSNVNVILPVTERCRTFSNLTLVAFLLEIRRQEKGDYPDRLETLLDEGYLPEPTVDRMNRDGVSWYKYHREGSGYLLYSVGMSGRDDGGNSEGWLDEETSMDDIVVRMD